MDAGVVEVVAAAVGVWEVMLVPVCVCVLGWGGGGWFVWWAPVLMAVGGREQKRGNRGPGDTPTDGWLTTTAITDLGARAVEAVGWLPRRGGVVMDGQLADVVVVVLLVQDLGLRWMVLFG